MADNENQENINVSSLISLCTKTGNLTAIQQLSLKQKVCFRFERILHNYMRNPVDANKKFATYITLVETKPEFFGNVCEILTENLVDEDTVEECLMYIRSGVIPYQIWTDKLIQDIKDPFLYSEASAGSMLAVYLGKTLKASLFAYQKAIKALRENENILNDDMQMGINFIKSRYIELPQRMKEDYMKAFHTDSEEMRRKFLENETSIFLETLVDMLHSPIKESVMNEEAGMSPFEDFWEDMSQVMSVGPAVPPIVVGGGDLQENAEEQGSGGNNRVFNSSQGSMGCWYTDVLGYGPNGETPEELERRRELAERQSALKMEEELPEDILSIIKSGDWDVRTAGGTPITYLDKKNSKKPDTLISNIKKPDMLISNIKKQYIVKKMAKDGSTRVLSTNRFNTKEEAERFVETITKANPEMSKVFDFKIESEVIS